MKSHPRSTILIAAAAAVLIAGAGCHGNPPVIELEDELVLFFPLAERTLGRFESRLGAEISDATVAYIESEAADYVRAVPSEDVYGLFEDYPDPSRVPPEEAAAKVGAEVWALGRITDFRLKDKGSINLLRGSSGVELEVWRKPPGGSARLVWSGRVEASFPESFGNEYGQVFAEEEDIREGLIAVTGRNIARKFYDYDDPGR